MLDTSNSGLFTDLEQLDLVSCRDSDTVHVFYVKSGQKAPNDIISNVVSTYIIKRVRYFCIWGPFKKAED